MFVFSLVIKVVCIQQVGGQLIKQPSFSPRLQDSDGDKSEDNLVVDVSNEVSSEQSARVADQRTLRSDQAPSSAG